jgi:hypothetical protein
VRVSRRLDGRLGSSMIMHPKWPRSSAVDPRHQRRTHGLHVLILS